MAVPVAAALAVIVRYYDEQVAERTGELVQPDPEDIEDTAQANDAEDAEKEVDR